MELAIPLVALSSLYFISISNNNEESEEGFQTNNTTEMELPNTNIPNANYPSEIPIRDAALDITTKLAVDNKYNGESYTDKFFNLADPKNLLKK